jgi:tetratricopeptide (TPR) repeat protein
MIESNNLKALFRASIALRSLSRFDDADKYLSQALNIDPNNRDLQVEAMKLHETRQTSKRSTNEATHCRTSLTIDQFVV